MIVKRNVLIHKPTLHPQSGCGLSSFGYLVLLLNVGPSGLPAIWKWLLSLISIVFLTHGGRQGANKPTYHTNSTRCCGDSVSANSPPLKMLFDFFLVSRQGAGGDTREGWKLRFLGIVCLIYAKFHSSSGLDSFFKATSPAETLPWPRRGRGPWPRGERTPRSGSMLLSVCESTLLIREAHASLCIQILLVCFLKAQN